MFNILERLFSNQYAAINPIFVYMVSPFFLPRQNWPEQKEEKKWMTIFCAEYEMKCKKKTLW